MSKVLELAPQDMTGLHRQVGMLPFQGLHTCQLIQADRPFSVLGPHGGLRIDLTALADLLIALSIRNLG
jgi:hypothetical protein